MKLLPMERRWARAIFDSMFPRGTSSRLPQGAVDLDIDGFLETTLSAMPLTVAAGTRAGVAFIGVSPPITIARLTTFDRLGPDERRRVLQRLAKSPLYLVRQIVVLLKTTGALMYCGSPAFRSAVMGPPASESHTGIEELSHVPG